MLRNVITRGSSGSSVTLTQDSNGLLKFYDTTRHIDVSVMRTDMNFGINRPKITGKRWLSTTGKVLTNFNGNRVIRDGVITAITVQCLDFTRSEFYIRKVGSSSDLYMLNLNGVKGKTVDNLSILINADDVIQCYVQVVSGFLYYPELTLEIAWR